MTRGGGRPRGGAPWGTGKSPRKPLRLSLGWGSVLFVVYLGARPGQRCLPGKRVGVGRCWEEQLAHRQEGQKVQFGHPSMTLFSQNLLVIYLETARNKTDPTDCSTPGFPVFRYLPELA